MEFDTDQLAKRTRLQRYSSNSEDVQRRFNVRSKSIKLSPCDPSTALFIVSPTGLDVTWNHREKSENSANNRDIKKFLVFLRSYILSPKSLNSSPSCLNGHQVCRQGQGFRHSCRRYFLSTPVKLSSQL
ncbi:hypothetical protein AVEN_207584-1 [Araneus ventricosus]|uniref:Uncharacterized protein n=1 Tax=Araneus ventricosus TaxID=182803 RepID=A0A4Y2HAZ7_ARAVE|nr:hypothetical protein AVEN_207584-1 [Araneus ventricosus]